MATMPELYKIFGGKILRKRPHGNPGNRWNDIKSDIREITSEDED
jgi:hypothetical protein